MDHDIVSRGTQGGGQSPEALRPALRLELSGKPHMPDLFADRLLAAIDAKKSPVCVGIDPMFEMLPDAVAGDAHARNANDAERAVDAIFDLPIGDLRPVAPHAESGHLLAASLSNYLTLVIYT